MKIAIVGCGAVGSFYGAKLLRAGHDVHFLLRSDFEVVRRLGVRVLSADGDFCARPQCARESSGIGVCDLVLIALKTTANAEFPRLLPPLVGSQTAVMSLQNGLGNEAALARVFPVAQILGGLCYVCLNRVGPGVIHHIAHGKILIGEHQRGSGFQSQDLCTCFKRAGIPCSVADNLERAHWEKLIWNIPFNGLGVAGATLVESMAFPSSLLPAFHRVMTTNLLLSDPGAVQIVRELMAEVIATANALGHAVPATLAGKNIANTRAMGAYRASTLIDFERGLPLELESLFLEPLRQARSAGVSTPRLARLCEVLVAIEATRRRA